MEEENVQRASQSAYQGTEPSSSGWPPGGDGLGRVRFWSIRLANIPLFAVIGTQLVATLITVYDLFMNPVGWFGREGRGVLPGVVLHRGRDGAGRLQALRSGSGPRLISRFWKHNPRVVAN